MASVPVEGVVPVNRELFWEQEQVRHGPTGMKPLEGFIQRNKIQRNKINIALPIAEEGSAEDAFSMQGGGLV
jgi:hypothetical protein